MGEVIRLPAPAGRASAEVVQRALPGCCASCSTRNVDGEPLDDGQIAAELHTLLVTGSETVELAAAAALVQLDLHPEQKARAIAQPELAPWVFAEAVRFDHPTDNLCRVVRRDTEIGGRQLRAGQGVHVAVGLGEP